MKLKVLGLVGLTIITVLMSAAALSQFKSHSRQSVAQEYEAKRLLVLGRMERAIREDDWDRLQRIERKYVASVKDPEFVAALHRAKAIVHGNETRKTFAIGKILDITRQQEAERSADNDRSEWLISTPK